MEKLKEISHQQPVIVDFFAPWCGPCKSVKHAYETLAEQETTVKFAKLDVDIYEVSKIWNWNFYALYAGSSVINQGRDCKVATITPVKQL